MEQNDVLAFAAAHSWLASFLSLLGTGGILGIAVKGAKAWTDVMKVRNEAKAEERKFESSARKQTLDNAVGDAERCHERLLAEEKENRDLRGVISGLRDEKDAWLNVEREGLFQEVRHLKRAIDSIAVIMDSPITIDAIQNGTFSFKKILNDVRHSSPAAFKTEQN